MAKLRVGVVYGGPSNEHEISISSGKAIVKNLDKNKYDILEVFINKNEKWQIDNQNELLSTASALEKLKNLVDVVFIGLHGTFGEDGHLQKLLDQADIKYTGSGAASSHLAFDKELAQQQYQKHGLLVPKWQIIKSAEEVSIDLPLVIKPAMEGSSVGVSIVKEAQDLDEAVKTATIKDRKVMAQEYIDGVEVSCGVLENPEPEALTPTELRPVASDFFDYKAKYQVGGTDEITPPELSQEVIEQIKDLAIKAHLALDCRGYSRSDMFIKDGQIYLIETNTLPGFTPTSILPKKLNTTT